MTGSVDVLATAMHYAAKLDTKAVVVIFAPETQALAFAVEDVAKGLIQRIEKLERDALYRANLPAEEA